MLKFKISPKQGVIVCHAEIVGSAIDLTLKMALDTGATYTMIPTEAAIAIGCRPLESKRKLKVTMGNGTDYVPVITIPKFRAFGVEIRNMDVVCHNLPTQSPVEGLLGLNFLKKAKIIINFSENTIAVAD